MKVHFQADADLNAEIVAGVLRREPSIDFQTADEANLRRFPDPEVLALAAQENRILVTHDRRGSSTVKRGHEHHRSMRRFSVREGRPRGVGGVQRGGGT
jgi:hypothetical protein